MKVLSLNQRIQVLADLGEFLKSELNNAPFNEAFEDLLNKVNGYNPWFTKNSVLQSLTAWSHLLNANDLNQFVNTYNRNLFEKKIEKVVLLILAGNIPLVGFHDVICSFLSGSKSMIKVSSKDSLLVNYLIRQIITINPDTTEYFEIIEGKATAFTHVIATGSTNSARYFDHYFSKFPHIIRKNRNSLAIIEKDTSDIEMKNLAKDVFQYFGLGCRNVTKLFVPCDFDFDRLRDAFQTSANVINHNKYANNYDYHKAIALMNGDSFIDFDFILLQNKEALKSPLGVLHFSEYQNTSEVDSYIKQNREHIQCVVCREGNDSNQVPFGQTQQPKLWDFADQIDTLQFLLS
jgi:hypothetical protein